jgi:hypothetical protein
MPPPLPMSPSLDRGAENQDDRAAAAAGKRPRGLGKKAEEGKKKDPAGYVRVQAALLQRRLGLPAASHELEECIEKGVCCMISLEAVHMIVRRAGGAAGSEVIRLVRLGLVLVLVLARQEY